MSVRQKPTSLSVRGGSDDARERKGQGDVPKKGVLLVGQVMCPPSFLQ